MAAEAKWKFQFREDQKQFLLHALEYISERCEERVSGLKSEAFNSFAATACKQRAEEIRFYIIEVST